MNQSRSLKRIVFSAAVAWLCIAVPYALASLPSPTAKGSILRDSARITFEWSKPVNFTIKMQGTAVAITFDRPTNANIGKLLSELYPYIKRAERKNDGKTIVFHTDQPYRIRTFNNNTINGIELLGVDPKRKQAFVASLVKKPETASPPPVSTVAQAEHQIPASYDSVPDDADTAKLAALAPAAGQESAEHANVPAVSLPSTGADTPDPVAKTDNASSTEPNDNNAQAASATQQKTDPNGPLKISVSAADDSAVLRFPFRERAAMAVFIRSHTLWVVFNKQRQVDISEFTTLPATVISKPSIVENDKATVLRIPVADNYHVSVAKEENGFDWAVLITAAQRPMQAPVSITINTEPPAPANVFIPTLEMADAITVTDPDIGDELMITPLFKLGEGVPTTRDFVEFSILRTAQGIAVHKKSDDVTMVTLRNGLRVAPPQGAMLSNNLPAIQSSTPTQPLQSISTLFPYELWKVENPAIFREELRLLFRRASLSENVRDANDARLRMAQMYLSQGMAAEALGVIDGIYRTQPSYYRSAKIAALRGAANFLLYRFSDAARDFSASELNNSKEMDYWRSMLSELLGNPDQSYDYIGMNDDYISKYPPVMRQRLAIVAADRAIAAKAYNQALQIFDILQKDNIIEPINAYVTFLLAKISAETGQEKEAMASWDKLAEDYRHPFVQARAEFSRVGWGLEHSAIDKEKAIDRLERLRLGWHGDNLEMNTSSLLGDLYVEKKDYINAMRIWHGLVTSFPNTAIAIETTKRMQDTFVILFNEGVADSLPPLDSLALYYQYRNYTPPGNIGHEMIEHLADRLVAIDLLDQAAALLDHQMRVQSEKEQRSHVGAKLARVYLNNRKPKKALEALAESVYGENQLMLRLQRNRLTAQALSELGQYDRALQVLGQDESMEAGNIRANIFWNQRDWTHLTTNIEGMLKNRPDITAPITLQESEFLLKLALAYVFENNMTQLQYLRDYFDPLMTNNPNRQVFDFITSSDVALTPTNFDEVMEYVSNANNFINSYQARIKSK